MPVVHINAHKQMHTHIKKSFLKSVFLWLWSIPHMTCLRRSYSHQNTSPTLCLSWVSASDGFVFTHTPLLHLERWDLHTLTSAVEWDIVQWNRVGGEANKQPVANSEANMLSLSLHVVFDVMSMASNFPCKWVHRWPWQLACFKDVLLRPLKGHRHLYEAGTAMPSSA